MAKSLEQFRNDVGRELGCSDWTRVDQPMIDAFAKVTGDHNFIHVDPVAAGATPFGGTIAHGLLTLSLLPIFLEQVDVTIEGAAMSVNYGFDKVRMIAPVPSGTRIRGRFTLKDLAERSAGQWLVTLGVSVEIDGGAKPALITDWLILQVF